MIPTVATRETTTPFTFVDFLFVFFVVSEPLVLPSLAGGADAATLLFLDGVLKGAAAALFL